MLHTYRGTFCARILGLWGLLRSPKSGLMPRHTFASTLAMAVVRYGAPFLGVVRRGASPGSGEDCHGVVDKEKAGKWPSAC